MASEQKKWPTPSLDLARMFHPIFGWCRVYPFNESTRGGTLIFPEQAVEWNTGAPPFPFRRDRVEVNEPIHVPDVTELREDDRYNQMDALRRAALQVERFPIQSTVTTNEQTNGN